MHVHRFHCDRHRHIHITRQEPLTILKKRVWVVHAVEDMSLDDTAITGHRSGVHQLIAAVVYGFNGQVLITKRDQYRKHILSRHLFSQIQKILAEFDVLSGGRSVIRQ